MSRVLYTEQQQFPGWINWLIMLPNLVPIIILLVLYTKLKDNTFFIVIFVQLILAGLFFLYFLKERMIVQLNKNAIEIEFHLAKFWNKHIPLQSVKGYEITKTPNPANVGVGYTDLSFKNKQYHIEGKKGILLQFENKTIHISLKDYATFYSKLQQELTNG